MDKLHKSNNPLVRAVRDNIWWDPDRADKSTILSQDGLFALLLQILICSKLAKHYNASKLRIFENNFGWQKTKWDDISWRYRKFHITCLIENSILHLFCSITFFVNIHHFEIMGFFEFLSYSFLNWNNTFLVKDTLNLMAHFRKEMKFSIFFVRDTFLIWVTV